MNYKYCTTAPAAAVLLELLLLPPPPPPEGTGSYLHVIREPQVSAACTYPDRPDLNHHSIADRFPP
tara:strand:+ start:324 stop:521 length:198 start_codon:yes stop_codon:yes gene_type:complete